MPVNTPIPGVRTETAHIGKSVLVRGELSGSEDLYVDGEVEGSIELQGNSLTVGPNGRVRASIHAREVVIHGRVAGNIRAVEKVELRKSANVVGDLATQRIAIEDGAYFKGGVDLQKQAAPVPPAPVVREPIADPVPETKPAAAAAGQSTIFEAGK